MKLMQLLPFFYNREYQYENEILFFITNVQPKGLFPPITYITKYRIENQILK